MIHPENVSGRPKKMKGTEKHRMKIIGATFSPILIMLLFAGGSSEEQTVNGQELVMYQTLLEDGTLNLTWPNGTAVSPEPTHLWCEGLNLEVGSTIECNPGVIPLQDIKYHEPCLDGEVRTDQGGYYCTIGEQQNNVD